MDIIVQKFGGTSVENKEKLEIVSKRIIEVIKAKKKVVVVVSAQGQMTDFFINKAKEYVKNTYPKEMDLLLSTGEIQTVALLTMLLKEKGYNATGTTGKQAGIITDSNHMNAQIIDVLQYNILNKLQENDVVVVAGFQGADRYGNITTLGRGGSDLSAVAIAACLKAQKCEIYTDVNGIYTGNPKIIKKAKLLESISYNEMLEAASAGAKVLHNRSIGMAKEYNIPILVRNSNKNNGGTIVNNKKNIKEDYNPKTIAIEEDLTKISVIGLGCETNPKYISKIYFVAKKLNTKIHMITVNEMCICILIKQDEVEEFVNEIHNEIFNIKE